MEELLHRIEVLERVVRGMVGLHAYIPGFVHRSIGTGPGAGEEVTREWTCPHCGAEAAMISRMEHQDTCPLGQLEQRIDSAK